MNRLLIVDDELQIRNVVKEYANLMGYEISEASDGQEAIDLVKEHDFDCVILDIMMPNVDGFTAGRQIKKIKDVPIIMLSARNEEYDKLFGFEIGVDDYVTKPFSPKVLMARIKVVIERHSGKLNKLLTFEGLSLDILGRVVTIDGERVNLTPREIDLLFYLVENKNIALTREKLLEAVWTLDYDGDARTVDTHIKVLRHSLKQYRKFIVTVRGMGYKFEA